MDMILSAFTVKNILLDVSMALAMALVTLGGYGAIWAIRRTIGIVKK